MATDSLFHCAPVSSVFGVAGALRVSHHANPSSQRAHAVLRRVEPSQSSSDDGEEPTVVCFKLYANKPISLKPGKELLLTIDCDDDRFKDHIVVFQGNLTTSDDESDHEGTTQVEEEPPVIKVKEEIVPDPIVPPKMRRQLWSRKLEEVSPVKVKAPVAHSSIGIQTQPTTASSSIQADVPPAKKYSFAAMQTDVIPLPRYMDSQSQTDLAPIELGGGVKQEPYSPEPDGFSAPLFSLETPWAQETFLWRREPSEDMVISIASRDMEMSLSPPLVKMEDLEDTIPSDSAFTVKIKEEPLEQEISPISLSPEIPSYASLTAAPNLPLPSLTQNPFVSGGFVTDLLSAQALPDKVVKAEEYDVPLPLREEQSATTSSAEVDVATSIKVPVPAPAPRSASASHRIISPEVRSLSTSIIPFKGPVASHKQRGLDPSQKSRVELIDLTQPPLPSSTPPPEPRKIASIPAGPSSNPLSIRPSKFTRPGSAAAAAKPKTKKPLMVGSGWPVVRPTTNTKESSVASTSKVKSKLVPAASNTAALVAYSSPSPPPSPVVANPKPVASKWKRIDSEISLRVPASDISSSSSKGRIPAERPPKLQERISTANVSHTGPKAAGSKPIDVDNDNLSLLHRLSWAPDKIEPQISILEKSPPKRRKKQKRSQETAGLLPVIHHSLPAKPPPPSSGLPPRGIKRERANSPDLWTAPGVVRIHEKSSSSTQRRAPSPDLWTAPDPVKQEPPPQPVLSQGSNNRWPTVKRLHSEMLAGDGNVGIRRMAFNPDGSFVAVHCWDRTLRIWNNINRIELVKLENSSQVVAFAWLDGEDAVLTLLENGVLGKWLKRMCTNRWEWVYILDAGSMKREEGDMGVCMAHSRDHIAISFPQTGVKVWAWYKGFWVAQRSITRTHVTALKFVDGGDALVGGTRDGVVWHCAVPNGTIRAYAFLQSSITAIDINATGTHALVTQRGGSACQVGLGSFEDKRVGKSYADSGVRDGALGAVFAGTTVVFGAVHGTLLAWSADAAIIYGMEHADGALIEAVASCDGSHACVLTGTRQGQLSWWPQLAVQPPRKRAKVR